MQALKPVRIHGVTIRPRWQWSKDYRATVLATWRPDGGKRDHDDYEATATKYARWLAARDRVDLSDEECSQCSWDRNGMRKTRVRAVRFYRVSEWTGGSWANPRRPAKRELIAEITIPHHDWQPVVVDHNAPALEAAE